MIKRLTEGRISGPYKSWFNPDHQSVACLSMLLKCYAALAVRRYLSVIMTLQIGVEDGER